MDAIQMEPIGKYKADRNGSAKGGAWRSMVENDLDDVAFLGESEKAREAQCEAGSGAVAVCSQRRALCVAALVFAAMFGTALLVAYAGPQPECPCADPRTLVPGRDAAREAGAAPARERVARDGGPFPWRGARLPPHIAPRHYELWLHPNLTTGEMKGEVSIDFKVDRETLFVVVNARDMNITERALFKAGGSFPGPKVARISEYLPADQFYIEFKEKLRRRYNYTLSLRFNSRLERNEKMKGFFVAGTHKSRAAMSRFWLTHARSAFPCFDEPQFKATFKLTIVRDRFHVSLTNMPIVATEEAGFYLGHRLLQDEFAPSPPMSPHMVALCVCALQRRAAPAVALAEGGAPAENVVPAEGGAPATAEPPPPFAPEVSLYTDQRALLDDAEPLLEWVSSTLQQYAWELNTSYPLPKLDIVVVEGGAPYSEGWGLITLAPNMVSDTKTLARLLAQQWFGGLVSPRWWSSQWLLEALTSVLGEQAPPHAYRVAAAPVARRDDDALLLEHTLPALRLDAAGGARPIAAQRLERADIESATDELSLHKGAALVSMALRAAGRVAAREALAALLRTHAHASADARDLWRALEAVAHLPAQAWETWSEQPGYPLVTVTKQGSDILVKQERFMMTAEPPVDEMLMGTELLTRELRLDLEQLMQEPENLTEIYEDENATTTTAPPTTTTKRPKPSKSPPPLKWIIPLTFIVGPPDPEYKAEMENASEAANGTNEWEDRWAENVTHLVWMNETTLTLHWLGRHAWVRFNVGARGVYRCAGLADGAEARSPAERALRLDDAFVLSRARTAPARRALAAVAQLLSERHWAPWRVALAHISAWQPLLVASAAGPAYEQFLAKLPPRGLVMEEPDLDSASDEHLSLRGALLAAGVNWGNEAATGKALKMFDAWYEHNQTIPILYQEAAYRAGVAKRGRDAWTACWRLLLSAPPLAQQDAALAALAGTRNDWLYARFIATLVAQPRASRWLHAAARASCGREGARATLWGAARALPAPRAATLLRDMAPCLHTERDYYEVKYIYGNASLVQSSRNWTQEATTVLETIALNAAWLKQAEPDLLEYFQQEPGI